MSFITSPGVIVPPLTAGGVAYGTGSQAMMTSAGTTGQVLTSNGAGVPSFAAAAGGFSTMQLFTSSGTFTIPSGKTTLKITVIGGGGGGAGDGITGATSGGSSSVSSGTEIISTITANGGGNPSTGGGVGSAVNRAGLGGTASGGDLNFSGGGGGMGEPVAYGRPGFGGATFLGGTTPVNYQSSGRNGLVYGTGGTGGVGVSGAGGGAGGGGCAIKYLTGLTSGNTLTIAIGAGGNGSGGGGAYTGGNGAIGVVVIEY